MTMWQRFLHRAILTVYSERGIEGLAKNIVQTRVSHEMLQKEAKSVWATVA